MSTYSTWDYYHATYKGRLPEDVYTQKALLASIEINRLTFGRAENAPDSMADQLALCECRMVDTMAASESLDLAPGVTHVNNDGFSISVEGGSAAARRKELESIAREMLTYPVNLLFCGAVVKSVHI